ncbi:cell growth regulator with EF hand domain protein 1 isoform X2 [Emydura macquarii macquarii]|uniref:cell growth regulator with EF hand domain protein 1 isoform X2 n=1 Tax=Emydura macquarii macquarii TaxID=1129001 RepID=UPI00352A3D4F
MQAAPSCGLTMRSLLLASLLLAMPPSQAAPQDGINRSDGPAVQQTEPVPNPLHPEPEGLRLLQSYLKSAKQMAEDPAHMTREQALLFLFALHDYDKSGQLDGLEFLHLLTEMGSQHAQGQPSPASVILVVDDILATQDLNGDGLLNPSELLLPPAKGQPPPPAQASAPQEERLVQQAAREPEKRPAVALEIPGPPGAADPGVEPPEVPGPSAQQPEAEGGPSPSPPGQETAAQPEEDGHWEAGAQQASGQR